MKMVPRIPHIVRRIVDPPAGTAFWPIMENDNEVPVPVEAR
jgi:hypothetical protein